MQQEHQLNEYEQAMLTEPLAAIKSLEAQVSTILAAIMRANKLDGNWKFEGSKLVKQEVVQS